MSAWALSIQSGAWAKHQAPGLPASHPHPTTCRSRSKPARPENRPGGDDGTGSDALGTRDCDGWQHGGPPGCARPVGTFHAGDAPRTGHAAGSGGAPARCPPIASHTWSAGERTRHARSTLPSETPSTHMLRGYSAQLIPIRCCRFGSCAWRTCSIIPPRSSLPALCGGCFAAAAARLTQGENRPRAAPLCSVEDRLGQFLVLGIARDAPRQRFRVDHVSPARNACAGNTRIPSGV